MQGRKAQEVAPLTIPVASAIVAGRYKPLGQPGKMPGFSWDIPVTRCRRGHDLRCIPGTACERCYAHRGWMAAQNVIRTQTARVEGLNHPLWVDAIAYLIRHNCQVPFFRWFSAGDLQSVDHLAKIVEVARRTRGIRHWLPTHEPYMVGEYLERGGEIPSNLCVRISADYVESAPTTPTYGLPTSTIHRFKGEPVPVPNAPRKASVECRAYTRPGKTCGKCRACWDPRVRNVSYLIH